MNISCLLHISQSVIRVAHQQHHHDQHQLIQRPPTHLFDRLHFNDGTVLTAAIECARGAVVVAVRELLSQDGRAAGTPLAQLWKRI